MYIYTYLWYSGATKLKGWNGGDSKDEYQLVRTAIANHPFGEPASTMVKEQRNFHI